MIIKAKHNRIVYSFFKKYTEWIIKRDFEKIEVSGNIVLNNKPILLISNHISWWDGFWALYLNVHIFKRKFHFMMLESHLVKYKLFNYIGGFSVSKNVKSVVESLQYAVELLDNKDNLVLIYPQGEIESMHKQQIHFEKGVQYILEHRRCDLQIIFTANFVDYFSHRKPQIYIYLNEFQDTDFSINRINECYNSFYTNCIESQIKIPKKR